MKICSRSLFLSIWSVSITTLTFICPFVAGRLLTHGHYDPETNMVDVCGSSVFSENRCCVTESDDIYLVWSHEHAISKLYMEHIANGKSTRTRLDQYKPTGMVEEEIEKKWRQFTPAMMKEISQSTVKEKIDINDIVFTSVKLGHLISGLQTLWFVNRRNHIPTIINCRPIERSGLQTIKCEWVI